MQITIGEYTTRNGCRAIVTEHYHSEGLFAGVVLLPGGLTQVYVWWDSNGVVNMPFENWTSNKAEWTCDFKSHKGSIFSYSAEKYTALILAPSPFDITEPKQMKEETKTEPVQKQRLIKLPNGTWLDPMTITSIAVEKEVNSHAPGISHKDRVLVAGDKMWQVLECQSLEQAQKLADELAEKVNSIK